MTVYEEIARLFGHPCDHKECAEILHRNGAEWCEKHCNAVPAATCWRHYFQIRKEYKNGKSQD